MFEPGEVETLAAHLTGPGRDPARLQRDAAEPGGWPTGSRWARVAGELESVYRSLAARRHDDARRSPAGRPVCARGR